MRSVEKPLAKMRFHYLGTYFVFSMTELRKGQIRNFYAQEFDLLVIRSLNFVAMQFRARENLLSMNIN